MAHPKWALVTGVSMGGMGEGEVKAFLGRGISVFATSVDIKMLENVNFNKGKDGALTTCLELDVTSPESIEAAVKVVESITGGRLDFLLNNAGYGYYMPFLDTDIEKAKKQYDVNVWGVFAVTQAFFPMLRVAKGTVINQASIAGLQGFNRPYMSVYNSSKAAVYSLSDAMRVEFSPFDVKVVTLVTGAVKTEFYNNKEGGRGVGLPSSSLYLPIQQHVEKMMRGSLAGSHGHDRLKVTRSTIAAILRRYTSTPRYIRKGYAAIKIWLIHLLFPSWLIDQWARHSGHLDKLRTILKSI